MTDHYLLHWALGWGAPPEVATAIVAAARPPLAPGHECLARAAVALEADGARGDWWSVLAARACLWWLTMRANAQHAERVGGGG